MQTDTLNALASVAHNLWCESLLSRGWRLADRYDAEALTHDALVPFDRLDRRDQRAARLGVLYEELADRLVGAISYSRGPNREFLVEEMEVGRQVVFCPGMHPSKGAVAQADVGTVETWTVDEEGELDLIAVRWPDGRVIEYAPGLLELARWEELK